MIVCCEAVETVTVVAKKIAQPVDKLRLSTQVALPREGKTVVGQLGGATGHGDIGRIDAAKIRGAIGVVTVDHSVPVVVEAVPAVLSTGLASLLAVTNGVVAVDEPVPVVVEPVVAILALGIAGGVPRTIEVVTVDRSVLVVVDAVLTVLHENNGGALEETILERGSERAPADHDHVLLAGLSESILEGDGKLPEFL